MLVLNPQTTQFVEEHENDDIRKLALKSNTNPEVDLSAALMQIAGRQSAKEKIPFWYAHKNILYPGHLPLEQCSSQITATYKASLCKGETLTDLTGGLGIDFAFMSVNFQQSTYVEQQEVLCRLADHNFRILGLKEIKIVHGNGVDFLKQMEPVDCIFIDPARRNEHGRKTVGISDCEPDIKKLSGFLIEKADKTIIKLSPMLDITQALSDMPMAGELHIVSADNECKELLLILNKKKPEDKTQVHCINIKKDRLQRFIFDYGQESNTSCEFTSIPEKYIYEPNSSILKAGAYKLTARFYQLKKFHPNSHLYTSDLLIKEFPGRIFEYRNLFSLNKKEVRTELNGISKANITVRNFPESVDSLRKRLKLKEGGDIYLFATTLENDRKVILHCSRLTNS